MGRLHRKPAGIGAYLLALTLMTVLPLAVFGSVVIGQLQQDERAALQRRTDRAAGAVAALVGQQLRDMVAILEVLRSSPELESTDLGAFHRRAQNALRGSSYFLLLVRPNGDQLLNTRVAFGTPLGKTSNMQGLSEAQMLQRPVVTDAFLGHTSGRWVYNVIVPVPDATSIGALILTQNVSALAHAIGVQPSPQGWSFAIIDSARHVVVASNGAASGTPFDPQLLGRIPPDARRDLDADIMVGHATVPRSTWQAVVWGPVATAQIHLTATWRALIIGGAVLVLLALVASLLVARYLRRGVSSLETLAERLRHDETVTPVATGLREFDGLAQAMAAASAAREQAQHQVELVLRELSHRTRNVVLIVQSLMAQTARQSDSVAAFRAAMEGRLVSLGRSIDLLTAENWGDTGLHQLLEAQLGVFVDVAARVDIAGDDVAVRSGAVKALGMIVHELATNALKYGALSVPDGHVTIRSDCDEADLILTWSERNGPALATGDRRGFGSQLIDSTVRGLGGTVAMEPAASGLRCTIAIPLAHLAAETGPPPAAPPAPPITDTAA